MKCILSDYCPIHKADDGLALFTHKKVYIAIEALFLCVYLSTTLKFMCAEVQTQKMFGLLSFFRNSKKFSKKISEALNIFFFFRSGGGESENSANEQQAPTTFFDSHCHKISRRPKLKICTVLTHEHSSHNKKSLLCN